MRLFAFCAVLVGSFVGLGATAAEATPAMPVCGQVWVEGDLVYPTTAGNCVNPGDPGPGTLCEAEMSGDYPQVYGMVYVCVPRPVTLP
jgi:hypothetical protein